MSWQKTPVFEDLFRLEQVVRNGQQVRAVYRAKQVGGQKQQRFVVLKITNRAKEVAQLLSTADSQQLQMEALENPWQESDLLRFIAHTKKAKAGVVEFYGDFHVGGEVNQYIQVLEYLAGGDLMTYIQRQPPYQLRESKSPNLEDEQKALDIFTMIVKAVYDLHTDAGIAHLDLKPENVMISQWDDDKDKTKIKIKAIKLIDFGLARLVPFSWKSGESHCSKSDKKKPGSAKRGTELYMAPEVFCASNDNDYDPFKADAWSLGCILFILLCKNHPYRQNSSNDVFLDRLVQNKHDEFFHFHGLDQSLSKSTKMLLSHLLCAQDVRWTVQELFNHVFNGAKAPLRKTAEKRT